MARTQEAQLRELHANLVRAHKEVIARPILGYIPHEKQLAAHKDTRPYVFFGGANRGGKSFFLAQDASWTIAGDHPYQEIPDPPYSIYIVSTNLDKIWNEQGQLVSLITSNFPPSHPMGRPYKPGDNVLEWHTTKGPITLYVKSHRQSLDSFKGGEPIRVYVDEEIRYPVFEEIRARRISRGGRVIIGATSTPEEGGITWIYDKILKDKDLTRNNHKNWGIYQVSAWDNPHLDHAQLRIEYEEMDPADRAVRIDGDLTPRAKLPVFNQTSLDRMWERSVKLLESMKLRYVQVQCDPGDHMPTFIDDELLGNTVIYKEPTPNNKYIVALDTSRGGLEDDYSCIQVFNKYTFEQVARFRDHVDVTHATDTAVGLAKYYNGALLAIELAKEGYTAVYRAQHDHKYRNLYAGRPIDRKKAKGGISQFGWVTNLATKPQMIQSLIDAIRPFTRGEAGALYVYDSETMKELRFYERKSSGKMGAVYGLNDDCVTALAIAVHLSSVDSVYVESMSEMDDRTEEQRYYDELHENKLIIDPDLGAIF